MHSTSTAYISAMKGQALLTRSRMGTRVTPHTTNSTTPTGGVSMPITRLSTNRKPKCSGSMPYCRAIGCSSGTSMM